MNERLYRLRRADETAGAAAVHFTLFAHGMTAANRADFRKFVRLRILRALVEQHAENLRNHVARALDRDRIADANAEPLDLVFVVQGRVLHHDAADRDRLEFRNRRELAGAADLNVDVFDDRRRLLGREFMRDRPARAARDEAEPLLPVEPVDLVDDAIDVVGQLSPLLLDLAIVLEQFLDAFALLHQRIDRQAPTLHRGDRFVLRICGPLARFAPGIGEELQGPRRGHLRIDLPERTRCRVARVHVKRFAFLLLPLV